MFRNSLQSFSKFLKIYFIFIFYYHRVSKEGNTDQKVHLKLAGAHSSCWGGLALLPTSSQLDWQVPSSKELGLYLEHAL